MITLRGLRSQCHPLAGVGEFNAFDKYILSILETKGITCLGSWRSSVPVADVLKKLKELELVFGEGIIAARWLI